MLPNPDIMVIRSPPSPLKFTIMKKGKIYEKSNLLIYCHLDTSFCPIILVGFIFKSNCPSELYFLL